MAFLFEKGFIPDTNGVVYYENPYYGKLSGFAYSDIDDRVNLVSSLYFGGESLTRISEDLIQKEKNRVLAFVNASITGELIKRGQPSDEVQAVATAIHEVFDRIETFGIYILTDAIAENKFFDDFEWKGKKIRLGVFDIESYFSLFGEKVKKIVIDFVKDFGKPVPSLFVAGTGTMDYDYALSVLPGDMLSRIYAEYGARIFDENMRYFNGFAGDANMGIRNTLETEPENFLASNNGLVIISDAIDIRHEDQAGFAFIDSLQGFQVIKGGQTIAALFHTAKENDKVMLDKALVAVKFIVPKRSTPGTAEKLAKHAHAQTPLRWEDFYSNSDWQCRIEHLSRLTTLSDGYSRVFYERKRGAFDLFLKKHGKDETRSENLKKLYPLVITKLGFAVYLNSWDQKPWEVARGMQTNFAYFMRDIVFKLPSDSMPDERTAFLRDKYDEVWFKNAVSKTFLYRDVEDTITGKGFPAVLMPAIVSYTVALIADRFPDLYDLQGIWLKMGLSPIQKDLVNLIALSINEQFSHSELDAVTWSKREECWTFIKAQGYSIRNEVLKRAGLG